MNKYRGKRIMAGVSIIACLCLIFYYNVSCRYKEMVFRGDVIVAPMERFHFISRLNSTSIKIGKGSIQFTQKNEYDYSVTVPVEKTDAIISDMYRIYEKHKAQKMKFSAEYRLITYFDGQKTFRCMMATDDESNSAFDEMTRYLQKTQDNYLPHKELDEQVRIALKQSASNEYERDISKANKVINAKKKYDRVKKMARLFRISKDSDNNGRDDLVDLFESPPMPVAK